VHFAESEHYLTLQLNNNVQQSKTMFELKVHLPCKTVKTIFFFPWFTFQIFGGGVESLLENVKNFNEVYHLSFYIFCIEGNQKILKKCKRCTYF